MDLALTTKFDSSNQCLCYLCTSLFHVNSHVCSIVERKEERGEEIINIQLCKTKKGRKVEEGGHETILLKTISSPYWYMIMNKNHSSPLFSFELPNHPCILYEVTWSKFQKLLNSYSVEKLPLHLGHMALRYIPLQCINHHQINWYPSRLTPSNQTNEPI